MICQHCGQGAIAKDRNGPICPDCCEEGYYEPAKPLPDLREQINDQGRELVAQMNAQHRAN